MSMDIRILPELVMGYGYVMISLMRLSHPHHLMDVVSRFRGFSQSGCTRAFYWFLDSDFMIQN